MKIKTVLLSLFSALLLLSCGSEDKSSIHIIPEPASIKLNDGRLNLDGRLYISVNDTTLNPLRGYAAQRLARFGVEVSEEGGEIPFNLRLSPSNGKEGSYTVEVTTKTITIAASSYDGIVNGISTLAQLIPNDGSRIIPATVITDSPRLEWRGVMLDVSRHFFTVDEIKELLDLMAFYKLNKFHWHLTDDQGWRIEIERYPLLTKKGAWRKLNNQDRECIRLAAVQDNSDFELPAHNLKIENGDTLYGGFYTKAQIKDIIDYAAVRGIDIIPEIDMPGHMLTAIENYDGISCSDKIGWGETFTSPLCPGKDSAIEFAQNVYKEVFELFPYEYVHLGADEVDKSNWTKCPDCQKRIKDNNLKDEHQLQSWFVNRMEEFFTQNGKKLIGWDEIIEGGLNDKATISWWRSWSANAVDVATAQGNEAIICPNEVFYFDYQQDDNTLKNLYDFEPVNPMLSPEQQKLVLGAQGNIWAEWIPSRERMYYMSMPRMLALSEICWVEPSAKEWSRFIADVTEHFKWLESMGIPFRPLDITVVPDYKEGINTQPQKRQASYAYTTSVNMLFGNPTPGVVVRYTTDGSAPTATSNIVSGPIEVNTTTEFKLRSFLPNGKGSETVTTRVVIAPCSPADIDARPVGLGLKAVWHDFKGDKCADIEKAPVKSTFKVSKVTIPSGVSGNIGLVITGYIDVPKDHVYTFALNSDDGSQLWIDDELTIDNDGAHSSRTVTGQKALAMGLHPIKVLYFDNNGGTLSLSIVEDGKETEISGEMFKL